MKKLFNALIVSTLGAALSIGIAVSINNSNNIKPAEAASHPSNYARYTYSGSYYSSALSTASEGMDGGLRTALTSLIHPTSVPSYSGGGDTHLSTVLQYADEDPDNSQNMIYLYTRDSVKKNAASSWNREHVWPQSLSNNCWGTGRAGTDLLHLRPTYNTTNSTRGNDKYGNVSNGTTRVYNGITYGYSSGGEFMPLDSVKGDVARIIMYVWTSYHDEYGSKLPAITNVFESFDTLMEWHTNDKPDIMEGNRNDYAEKQSMQKNRNPFVDHPEYAWKIFGNKCSSSVLSAAKAAYPADGSSGGETPSTYVSLDKSSSTLSIGGTLSLTASSSDSSNISWSTTNSTVASISNNSTASGGTITVTANAAGSATIYAQNTSGAKAYCSITVESGSGGSVDGDTITFDLSQGTYSSSIITWKAAPITIKQIKGNGQSAPNNSYIENPRVYKGNILSFEADSGYKIKSISIPYDGSYSGNGLTAGTTISNNSVQNNTTLISRSFSSSPLTATATSSEGLSTIHIQNAGSENTQLRPTGFSVTLVGGSSTPASPLKSIAVSGMTQNYYVGDTFSFDGTCTATYEDDSTKPVKPTSVSSPDMTTSGNKTITISYTENNVTKTTTYTISVVPVPILSNIAISGTLSKTSYYSGDTFDPTGLTVTATYTNGSTKNVTSDVDWTPSPLETGNISVTATYQGKTAVYNGITVAPLTLSSIILSGQTTTFEINDEFSFDGSVLATYTNGSKRQVDPTNVDSSNVNMSRVGTYSVRVSYTENGVTKNATYTISVIDTPFVNTIEECYSKTDGASITDVYGLYVGSFNDGESSIIMNGEYGIMLYQTPPVSTWVENQTYIRVKTAKLKIYENLYELINSAYEAINDSATIREKVAPTTTYTVTGSETTNELDLANRLCLMTGKVNSIEKRSSSSTEYIASLSVNGNDVQVFIKTKMATAETIQAFEDARDGDEEITLKGITGFYKTSFQVQLKNLVVADASYTAEMFAQELLNLTNTICSSSANKESDLSGVWLTLELDKWPTLSSAQQQRLINAYADKDSSDVIEQAMARYDQICKKYASCTNFIGRESANNLNNKILSNLNMSNSSVIIIVAIGTTISLSLLAFLLLKKKRKTM